MFCGSKGGKLGHFGWLILGFPSRVYFRAKDPALHFQANIGIRGNIIKTPAGTDIFPFWHPKMAVSGLGPDGGYH